MSKTDLAVFPCQTVPKKYPRRISPRIMIYYAPIAKAIRQARQARRRRSPCRLSVCFARCAVFGVLHCPNRAQKQSHTHDAKTKPKANTRNNKSIQTYTKQRKHTKTIKASKAIYKHLTISKTRKAKQDKEKSKRDPRKAYKHTSKEGKAILFPPMPIYRIAIYYNKAI